MENKMYTVQSNISWKKLEDSVVIVNTDTGMYYTLNATAGLIWTSIMENVQIEDIVLLFENNYQGADRQEILADIQESIQFWIDEALIIAV